MNNYFNFPFEITKDEDYYKAFSKTLNNFINNLENISKSKGELYSHLSKYQSLIDESVKNIKDIKDKLLKSFREALKGNYSTATSIVRNIINKYEDLLVCPLNESHAFLGGRYFYPESNLDRLILFRGRIGDSFSSFKHDEMIHIPLNRRELVNSYRFSLAGTPCIYLAQNSYVVWKEMDCPDYDKLSISAIELTHLDNKIIDLTFPHVFYSDLLSDEVEINDSNVKKYLKTFEIYPLILSCSFHCSQSDRRFKSEYVIPQLIMQTVGDKYIGVAYKSNRIDPCSKLMETNLAIPIIKYKWGSRFGSITNSMNITDSLNFGYFKDIVYGNYSDYGIEAKGFGKGKGTFKRDYMGTGKYYSPFNESLNDMPHGSYDGIIPYLNSPFSEFDDFLIYQNEFKQIK